MQRGEQLEGLNLFSYTEIMKDASEENIFMSVSIFKNFDMVAMATEKWQGFHDGNIHGKLSFFKSWILKNATTVDIVCHTKLKIYPNTMK